MRGAATATAPEDGDQFIAHSRTRHRTRALALVSTGSDLTANSEALGGWGGRASSHVAAWHLYDVTTWQSAINKHFAVAACLVARQRTRMRAGESRAGALRRALDSHRVVDATRMACCLTGMPARRSEAALLVAGPLVGIFATCHE